MSDVPVCVLDISVLLYTPEALYDFPDKEVVLPVCLLEELDYIKMDLGEKGRSAQIITRMLDECRQLGSLTDGVCLPNGGKLRIDLSEPDISSLPYIPDLKKIANKILAFAWTLYQESSEVVFISLDGNLRTKADILHVPTICYQGNKLDDSILYSGIHRYNVDKQTLRRFSKQPLILKEEIFSEYQQREEINPNEGLLLRSPELPDEEVLATYNS
ncbi:PIN domain-containing protein, partial [bacterium]|nr:PIN domain-containing protein [bacterium]